MAQNLAGRGYTPVLIARDRQKLNRAVAALTDLAGDAAGYSGDVSRQEDMEQIVSEIRDRFGRIDFLILNAGVVHVSALADIRSIDDLRADIEVNLWGTVLSAKVYSPLVPEHGRILMISSGFGLMGAAGYAAYCASKAGIINFAESLRRELLAKNIAVYVACPADIDTPQFAEEQEAMPEWMKLARARGKPMPAEMAAAEILRKCTGARFLITINTEIKLLLLLSRFLPRRLRDAIVDRMFPRP